MPTFGLDFGSKSSGLPAAEARRFWPVGSGGAGQRRVGESRSGVIPLMLSFSFVTIISRDRTDFVATKGLAVGAQTSLGGVSKARLDSG